MTDDELIRRACPSCGKEIDVVSEPFSDEGLVCPYCGAEFE